MELLNDVKNIWDLFNFLRKNYLNILRNDNIHLIINLSFKIDTVVKIIYKLLKYFILHPF